jgi:hypothetical protein
MKARLHRLSTFEFGRPHRDNGDNAREAEAPFDQELVIQFGTTIWSGI